MTPIQQAIEQVKLKIEANKDYKSIYPENSGQWQYYHLIIQTLKEQLNHLQSLLPVEKEWAVKVFDAGWQYRNQDEWEGTEHPDFEQYYLQFNEVK